MQRTWRLISPFIVGQPVLAGAILIMGMLSWNTFEGDPSIYLPYAQNIARGHPFQFNPGEFSSGSTSALWPFILAPAFLFPAGVTIAKLIAFAFTLAAMLLNRRMFLATTKAPMGTSMATALLVYFAVAFGMRLYEISFALIAIGSCILLMHELLSSDAALTRRQLTALAVTWALMPLLRPDAMLIVLGSVGVLSLRFARDRRKLLALYGTLALAMVPSALYFGYSYVTTGHFSVSSYCRAFFHREKIHVLKLGGRVSPAPARMFATYPLILCLGPALWGFEKLVRTPERRWFGVFVLLCAAGYFATFTFVQPVTDDLDRYLIPSFPFLFLAVAVGLENVWQAAVARKYVLVPALLLSVLWLMPLFGAVKKTHTLSKGGYTLDAMLDRGIVEYMNGVAEPRSTVLMMEVQARLFVRPDMSVLGLDGITDGKVAPYMKSGDMAAFLNKYRPRYWMAKGAVEDRPFLRGSILQKVLEKTGGHVGSRTTVEGMTFTNLKISDTTHPWAYRQLYVIDYGA